MLTLVLVIMGDVVTLRDRAKYSGIIEAVIALSNGVGPTVGGALTTAASWRWCFWINLPICAAVMAIIVWCLPQKKVEGGAKEKLKRIDYVGSALSLAASILILVSLHLSYSFSPGTDEHSPDAATMGRYHLPVGLGRRHLAAGRRRRRLGRLRRLGSTMAEATDHTEYVVPTRPRRRLS